MSLACDSCDTECRIPAADFSCRSQTAMSEKIMNTIHDIGDRIQRIPDAERHFSINLDSLSAFLLMDEGEARLRVAGEVVAAGRGGLSRNITVVASAHDSQGRVLAVSKDTVSVDGFYELQAFSMPDYDTVPSADVAAVKIYPCGY